MPTRPQKTKSLNELNSPEIVNAIVQEAGIDAGLAYLPGNPMANGRVATMADSVESLRAIGDIVMSYTANQNAFLNALVNRIARVIITSRLYENPWNRFKKGLLEYGETVEEIFVGLARPYQYNPVLAEDRVFKRRIPDVKAAFHTMNYQKFYPTTVSNDDLRQAFLSWEGVTDLISRIIEQIYTGANYDEFLVMKYMIARAALDGLIYPVHIDAVSADNARSVTTQMVAMARNLGYMKKKYNYANVETYTDPRYLYMILTTDIQSIFDVEVLALSFNMSKAELIGRQIGVDGFGEIDEERLALIFADDPNTGYVPFTTDEIEQLKGIAGLMVDESWFMIFDNYQNMTDIYNPEGLYWNYFYHRWQTFSISPFSNAVMFTQGTPEITSVAVTPSTATVKKGATAQFTATVVGTGFAQRDVTWSVTGSDFSHISPTGMLTVDANETASTLTVTATSIFDTTKSATATVTVED